MRRLALLLLVLVSSTACGAAAAPTPVATSAQPATRFVSAGAAIEALPATSDGTARIRTRVTLVGADGEQVATLDLGETVSADTCAPTSAPSIADERLSITFECGTPVNGRLEHVDYRVTLVDHHDHVAIWTFLGDDGAGNWARMGDLYVPGGTRVRLLSELVPNSPAQALATP